MNSMVGWLTAVRCGTRVFCQGVIRRLRTGLAGAQVSARCTAWMVAYGVLLEWPLRRLALALQAFRCGDESADVRAAGRDRELRIRRRQDKGSIRTLNPRADAEQQRVPRHVRYRALMRTSGRHGGPRLQSVRGAAI